MKKLKVISMSFILLFVVIMFVLAINDSFYNQHKNSLDFIAKDIAKDINNGVYFEDKKEDYNLDKINLDSIEIEVRGNPLYGEINSVYVKAIPKPTMLDELINRKVKKIGYKYTFVYENRNY